MALFRFSDGANGNIFSCPCCFEKTRHIRVSQEEAFSITDGTLGRIVGGIAELSGTSRLSSFLMNCYYWKCTKCSTITMRKSDGTIRRVFP